MDGDVGRPVEHPAALPLARLAGRAQREDHISGLVRFMDDMIAVVGQEQVAVRRYGDSVGTVEHALTPRINVIPGGIEDDYRAVATIENVNAIAVHGQRGGVLEPDALRDGTPQRDGFVDGF